MTQDAPSEPSGTEKPTDMEASVTQPATGAESSQPAKGFRFWAVMVALAAGKLMLALEITIISTAMPTIASALNMGGEYVWASNGAALARFVLSSFSLSLFLLSLLLLLRPPLSFLNRI